MVGTYQGRTEREKQMKAETKLTIEVVVGTILCIVYVIYVILNGYPF